MKLCLHSGHILQNTLHFDEIFFYKIQVKIILARFARNFQNETFLVIFIHCDFSRIGKHELIIIRVANFIDELWILEREKIVVIQFLFWKP